ncbi:MAG: YdbC family protein [Treponema sp.]|nr:YdbC family protein [Treponema sp.]
MADDFTFSVEQSFGVLSEGKGGWKTELNLVSWSGRPAKYDIRPWSPDHTKMGKGITLTGEELAALRGILDGMQL